MGWCCHVARHSGWVCAVDLSTGPHQGPAITRNLVTLDKHAATVWVSMCVSVCVCVCVCVHTHTCVCVSHRERVCVDVGVNVCMCLCERDRKRDCAECCVRDGCYGIGGHSCAVQLPECSLLEELSGMGACEVQSGHARYNWGMRGTVGHARHLSLIHI